MSESSLGPSDSASNMDATDTMTSDLQAKREKHIGEMAEQIKSPYASRAPFRGEQKSFQQVMAESRALRFQNFINHTRHAGAPSSLSDMASMSRIQHNNVRTITSIYGN